MAHVGKVLFGIALLVTLPVGAYLTGVMVGPPPVPDPLPSSAETAPADDSVGPGRTDRPASSSPTTPASTPTDTVATSDDATHATVPQDGARQQRPGGKEPGKKDPGKKDRGEKDRGEKDRGEKDRGEKDRGKRGPDAKGSRSPQKDDGADRRERSTEPATTSVDGPPEPTQTASPVADGPASGTVDAHDEDNERDRGDSGTSEDEV